MVIGVKKYVKKDVRDMQLVTSLPPLVNAVFIYGKTGSGKTLTELTLCQKYHDIHGYKIFDLWGGERKENLMWCFPSKASKYWSNIKKRHNLVGDGPKQYKVNILYPYYKKMLPKKLPCAPPYINSHIFTIPIKEIKETDAKFVLGLLSERDSYVLRESLAAMNKRDGPAKLAAVAKKLSTKNQSIYRSFIKPLCESLLLQNSFSDVSLDLEREMEDKETITIFCLDFLPEEFRLFVLGFIIRTIHEFVIARARGTKNILLLREASEFFKATEDSIAPPEKKIFRDFLANVIRYGRAGTHIVADSQSPYETKKIVDGSQDYTILCKLPSQQDREAATEQMRIDGLITATQIRRIASFEPGRFLFCKSGEKVKEMCFFKPRTMYWEAGIGDFHKVIWPKMNGGLKDFSIAMDTLDQNYYKELKVYSAEEDIEIIEDEEDNSSEDESYSPQAKAEPIMKDSSDNEDATYTEIKKDLNTEVNIINITKDEPPKKITISNKYAEQDSLGDLV